MILACMFCGDNVGYFQGVVEKFVCMSCLEDSLMGVPSDKHPSPAPQALVTSQSPLVAAPVFFRCPSCNRSREWFLEKPPWPGAICRSCYSEELMRRDEARKARGGQDAS